MLPVLLRVPAPPPGIRELKLHTGTHVCTYHHFLAPTLTKLHCHLGRFHMCSKKICAGIGVGTYTSPLAHLEQPFFHLLFQFCMSFFFNKIVLSHSPRPNFKKTKQKNCKLLFLDDHTWPSGKLAIMGEHGVFRSPSFWSMLSSTLAE